MLEVGFLIWHISAMPNNPMDLVKICRKYGIKRLAIKVLDGRWKYNVVNGDKPLKDYMDVLSSNGIIVEAWGYHYPDQASAQGDAIEERRQKFGFQTYHVNCEAEWQRDYGMAKPAKILVDKPKKNNFEMFLCSYRSMPDHPNFPFNAFMSHEAIDGATPQVYWADAHNPVEQLNKCLKEYKAQWDKPIYPMGPTFGSEFTVAGKKVYWEPTVEELVAFRQACVAAGINRIYYYSLDWALAKKHYDWIEAATGTMVVDEPPPPPLPSPDVFEIVNCSWLNGRSSPEVINDPDYGNKIVTIRSGQQVVNLHNDIGDWRNVQVGLFNAWMHGDYLDKISTET